MCIYRIISRGGVREGGGYCTVLWHGEATVPQRKKRVQPVVSLPVLGFHYVNPELQSPRGFFVEMGETP